MHDVKNSEVLEPQYLEKLAKIGIKTAESLLKRGATSQGRKEIEQKTGIPYKGILKWVVISDLLRIRGMSVEYSKLLKEAGISSIADLAQRDSDNLFKKIVEINSSKKIVEQLPELLMVKDWTEQAKILPSIIKTYNRKQETKPKIKKRSLPIGLIIFLGVLFLITSLIVITIINSNNSSDSQSNLSIVDNIITTIETSIVPSSAETTQVAEKITTTSTATTTVPATTTTITATTRPPLKKFSFDEYITTNTREYNLVKEENISIKALGNKLPSEYTQAEIDKLPINFRMKYSIVVPRDITEEELKSTLAYIIETKSYQDLSIDEIYVAAWYDLESVEKQICLARAEWCPEGRWEQMPPAIAENDIRDSYLVKFYFNSAIEQPDVKYGLTEQQRKQAFYEIIQLQDQVSLDDPQYDQKQEEAYVIVAKKYGISRDEAFTIGVEGITKGWPMPPIS